jgi:hypothetical protein
MKNRTDKLSAAGYERNGLIAAEHAGKTNEFL